jgi:hypothetical protein
MLLAISTLLVARASNAAPFTWEFEGRVAAIVAGESSTPVADPGLSSLAVAVGTPFTARFTIEALTPDANPDPDFGSYDRAVLSVEYSAGALHKGAGPETITFHVGAAVAPGFEWFTAYGESSALETGFFANPIIGLEIQPQVDGVFPSDALPIEPVPLSALHSFGFDPSSVYGWGTDLVVIARGTTISSVEIRNEITSWVLLPEPSALVFLALGSLASAAARSR